MRIAVVGTGVSGLVAARLLQREHEVVVFEASDRVGGHMHTHDVELAGRRYAVDTGFIVYNERTYPRFTRLLDELGVATRASTMSFSVREAATGIEWCGTSLDAVFAQRRNALRPSFWVMLRDVLRFGREAPALLDDGDERTTLGAYLRERRYSRAFVDRYVVPMGAAIWSAEPARMLEFPARTFVRFFSNHGMLSIDGRPTWRTVVGGSRTYVDALVAPFRDAIRTDAPVAAVRRLPRGVEVLVRGGAPERFDEVVVATHSDQALRLLADASPLEREILGAIPYQRNDAVLHTDAHHLPRTPRARAAWNYLVPATPRAGVEVTYDMNELQGLDAPERLCVTLNPGAPIDPARVIARMTYHHPVFTAEGVAAQRRRDEIDGVRGTHFCGAYWGYGFHEDGVVSALHVARRLDAADLAGAAA